MSRSQSQLEEAWILADSKVLLIGLNIFYSVLSDGLVRILMAGEWWVWIRRTDMQGSERTIIYYSEQRLMSSRTTMTPSTVSDGSDSDDLVGTWTSQTSKLPINLTFPWWSMTCLFRVITRIRGSSVAYEDAATLMPRGTKLNFTLSAMKMLEDMQSQLTACLLTANSSWTSESITLNSSERVVN